MNIETVINVLAELLYGERRHEQSMANGHGRALVLAIRLLEELSANGEVRLDDTSGPLHLNVNHILAELV